MDYAIFPMRTINITQRANSNYSHKNLQAWDCAGEDGGIDVVYAPCMVKCLGFWGNANTVLFGSCDINGNAAVVMTENGVQRVLTFAFTHCDDISWIKKGKIYDAGEICYKEGTHGNATGNHIHMEVAEGWQYKKHLRSDGIYELDGITNIADIFYQLEDFTKTKNTNGYNFKSVSSRSVVEQKPTYTLCYSKNCDDDVNGIPETQYHKEGEEIYISATVPNRAGYIFEHWNSQPNDSGYIYFAGDKFNHDWYTCLWAIWTKIETFNIYYEPNGSDVENMPANQTKQTGETVMLSSAAPTRQGYKFSRWCVHADGDGTTYAPGDKYSGDWSSSLYAQWVRVSEPSTYSLTDAMKVFRSVAKKISLTEDEKKRYDINGDGEITIADAMRIFQDVCKK